MGAGSSPGSLRALSTSSKHAAVRRTPAEVIHKDAVGGWRSKVAHGDLRHEFRAEGVPKLASGRVRARGCGLTHPYGVTRSVRRSGNALFGEVHVVELHRLVVDPRLR